MFQAIEGGALKGRCENLHEEYQYRFRIIAVNRAGKSLHGPSSENVTAMHKNIPPFIKGDGLTDFNMKQDGKQFRFDIWVGGEPVPTIEWLRNDVKVVNDGSTNVNVYTKSSSAYTLKNAVLSVPKVSWIWHSDISSNFYLSIGFNFIFRLWKVNMTDYTN